MRDKCIDLIHVHDKPWPIYKHIQTEHIKANRFIISLNNHCTNSAMIGYNSHVTQDEQTAVSRGKEIFYSIYIL